MAKPFQILFVCTGNICRSPMAEAMLKNVLPADLQQNVRVASAGTRAGDGLPAKANAVLAMKEFSVDLSRHRSRMIQPETVAASDLILVMEKLHGIDIRDFVTRDATAIHLLGAFGQASKNGEIPDPYGGDLARYRRTAMQIRACLEGVIQHLRQALST